MRTIVQTSPNVSRINRIALPFILLVAAFFLLWDLGGRALWWDEIVNVGIDRYDLHGILVNLRALPGDVDPIYNDVRPPFFHFIQHFWIGIAGTSDLAVRVPNVIFALLTLCLLYLLAQRIDDKPTGFLAFFVAAISPFWLLYARMARYYSLTAFLAIASTLLFIELLRKPSLIKWAGYFAVAVIMLYTDYLIATIFICQALYLMWVRPGRRWCFTWAGVMAAVGVSYLPWLPAWRMQSALMSGMNGADLSSGLIGTLIKFAFPLSSFTVGETVFPWEAPAILGYALFGALFIMAVIRLWRHPKPADWPGTPVAFGLLFSLVPTIGTIMLITFVTPTIPFIGIPNRTFFAFPFVALLAGLGLRAIVRPLVRGAVVMALMVILAYPIINYYAGRHFMNPIYAVPLGTVVNDILARTQPGDAVFSDIDTGFSYQLDKQSHPTIVNFYTNSTEGIAALQNFAEGVHNGTPTTYKRIFLLTYGRDRTRYEPLSVITQEIQPRARLVWESGYTPEDELYRAIKQRLLGREDYQYKLLVQLYELP